MLGNQKARLGREFETFLDVHACAPNITIEISVCKFQEYIHLKAVQEVWCNPKTANPYLEPAFCAAMHSIEIGPLFPSSITYIIL